MFEPSSVCEEIEKRCKIPFVRNSQAELLTGRKDTRESSMHKSHWLNLHIQGNKNSPCSRRLERGAVPRC